GEPEDIIFAVKYGFDMFDCVLPTRLARHGTIWTTKDWQKFQKIDLKKSTNLQENEVMMKGCQCPACAGGYSRAYISYLIREKEMLGLRLASLHNLYLYFQLMYNLRRDIL
ncbi:MAG: tRNA-guanine transglycosylase, partial [Patescibacteria group bacterium]